ncbi:rhomboid family intramembrane serine protease [Flavobacterium sp. J372]|uniref:rhomboid family intramembrane serine protease n=1 Tax=Flavobacterium sp. J372 TaxID=2898436 RepID=UPI0027E275AB|nr:rhomboid family intramembrane serine protease [Flavobacterium sp. J372]
MNMRISDAVKHLIIINIIFFIGSQVLGRPATDYLALHMPQSEHFQIWQLFTHMFMHGNIMHIFFNMFALFSFGVMLEQFWGSKKFIFFYLSCGIGAAALHLGVSYFELQNVLEGAASLNLSSSELHQILNATVADDTHYRPDLFLNEIKPILENAKVKEVTQEHFDSLFSAARITQIPMVGASGAIYGILVAFAFLVPNAELMLMFIPVPIKAKYFVPGLLLIDLFLGLKGQSIFGSGSTGVAHFAHLGGALIGFIMMWYWKKSQFNNNRWN